MLALILFRSGKLSKILHVYFLLPVSMVRGRKQNNDHRELAYPVILYQSNLLSEHCPIIDN